MKGFLGPLIPTLIIARPTCSVVVAHRKDDFHILIEQALAQDALSDHP
jgi:hypothetical protein